MLFGILNLHLESVKNCELAIEARYTISWLPNIKDLRMHHIIRRFAHLVNIFMERKILVKSRIKTKNKNPLCSIALISVDLK